MKKFEIAFPIVSGFQVFTIEAPNETIALEWAMNGDSDGDTYYDCVEVDFDSNLATIEEIDE